MRKTTIVTAAVIGLSTAALAQVAAPIEQKDGAGNTAPAGNDAMMAGIMANVGAEHSPTAASDSAGPDSKTPTVADPATPTAAPRK